MEKKSKYMSLLFLKIKDEYCTIEGKSRIGVTKEHVEQISKYSSSITHVLCLGFSGKYDQINLLEANDLETLYRMTEDFKMGAKSKYIEVVDAVVGIKVDNKCAFNLVGSH